MPPTGVAVGTKFLRQGIRYDDLSEEEKDQWDALDWGEDGPPDEVGAEELNRFLFNEDTVDKVLGDPDDRRLQGRRRRPARQDDHLRQEPDARRVHRAALRHRLPRATPATSPASSPTARRTRSRLIDDFSIKDKAPHIAITVDMLDTGIDVPEVVNLVFFKLVRSKTKFWQMIGRGTRLCPDLFGPGRGQEGLLRLRLLRQPRVLQPGPARLRGLAPEVTGPAALRGPPRPGHRDSDARCGARRVCGSATAKTLHEVVAGMNLDNFLVRPHRRGSRSSPPGTPGRRSRRRTPRSRSQLAGLPSAVARRRRGRQAVRPARAAPPARPARGRRRHRRTAPRDGPGDRRGPARQDAIPSVAEQAVLLGVVAGDEWWVDVTLPMLELARLRVRGPGAVRREDQAQPGLHRLRGRARRQASRSSCPVSRRARTSSGSAPRPRRT